MNLPVGSKINNHGRGTNRHVLQVEMSGAAATIIKSGMCRTTAKLRPSPSLFYFPGLTSRPFWDANQFGFCRRLEASAADICEEFERLRAEGPPSDYEVGRDEHTLHKGRWDWLSWSQGAKPRSEQFEAACPVTVALLRSVPDLMLDLPFAYAFFSTLHPGAAIAPHSAPCNLRLRVHLPLVVPTAASAPITTTATDIDMA